MSKLWVVDIVIPTCRPDIKLKKLMYMLKRQTYPIDKVIIMNTGTQEPLLPYLKGGQAGLNLEIHDVKPQEFDHGKTRNMGASYATGDITVFMTQDAVPADIYLIERLLEPFSGNFDDVTVPPGQVIAASYARQLAAKDCRLAERYTRNYNYPSVSSLKTKDDLPKLGIKTYFCSDVCAAYRMDLFKERQGFISPAIFNEDMIYAAKAVEAGEGIAYAAKAKVVHSHNYSKYQQFQRNFNLAVSQAMHPEVFDQVPSEGEGIKLVKSTAAYLAGKRKPWLIPDLVLASAAKYAGFFLGKHYRNIPLKWVKRISNCPWFWD